MKNTLLLTLLFSILALSLISGQESIEFINPAKKSTIGIVVTPLLTYKQWETNTAFPDWDEEKARYADSEKTIPGYAIGVSVSLPLFASAYLELGAGYAQKRRHLIDHYWWPTIGVADVYSVSNTRHIDFPFGIQVINGKNSWQWSIGAGLTTNVLLNETVVDKFEFDNGMVIHQKDNVSSAYEPITFSPYFKFGIQHHLTKTLIFTFSPMIQYGLTAVNQDIITWRMWHAGLALGVHHCL
jgi:hypothetical protein